MTQTVGAHILERLHGHGIRPGLRLSGRRHQRHPRRLPRARRRDRVHPGRPRGARRVHGVRAREVQRRRRRLPGDLRARARSTCSTGSTTPSSTTSRWSRSSASRSAISLGAELPAGGRPRLAVQGRRERVRPGRDRARAGHAPDRPRGADRPRHALGHLRDRPDRPPGGGRRGAAARARRRLLRRARCPSRGCCRTRRTSRGRPRCSTRASGSRSSIGQGARGAAAEVERGRRAPRRRRRQGAQRPRRAARRPAVRHRLDRPARDEAERRDDAGLRHAADGRLRLPVLGVAARAGPGARRADRHRRAHARHPLPDGGQPRRRRARHAARAAAAAAGARRTAPGRSEIDGRGRPLVADPRRPGRASPPSR